MSFKPAEQPFQNRLVLPPASTVGAPTIAQLLPPFVAFARVLNPARSPKGGPVRWSEISNQPITSQTAWKDVESSEIASRERLTEPVSGSVDPAVARRLIALLAQRTKHPNNCYFLAWEGYADLRGVVRSSPQVAVAPYNRRMYVMQGRLRDAGRSIEAAEDGRSPMWWLDADGAWCVGNDIYARSVYVGGDEATINAILGDAELESFSVDAEQQAIFDDD